LGCIASKRDRSTSTLAAIVRSSGWARPATACCGAASATAPSIAIRSCGRSSPPNGRHSGGRRAVRTEPAARLTPPPLGVFLTAVVGTGAAIIAHSLLSLHAPVFNAYALLLAVLTIAGGRFTIPIPGRPATVSVSEVFVFASVLLFGPAVPVLTVAIDGLYIRGTQ